MVYDQQVLQVERMDAPPWLWNSAVTLVLGLCVGLLFLIAVGVGRVARATEAPRDVPAASRARVTTPVPAA